MSDTKTNDGIKNMTYYSGVMYITKAPQDWLYELHSWGFPSIVSPLHNKDINKNNNNLVEPHYHIVIKLPYEIIENEETINHIFTSLGCFNYDYYKSNNIGLYLRHLCGIEDFVDKCLNQNQDSFVYPKYPIDEIININGTDYKKMCYIPTAKEKVFNDICSDDNIKNMETIINLIQTYQFFSPILLKAFLANDKLTIDRNWSNFYIYNVNEINTFLSQREFCYITGLDDIFYMKREKLFEQVESEKIIAI